MKIVVFGATGMIGTRIAAELEQRGHAMRRATRTTGVDATDPPSVAGVPTQLGRLVRSQSQLKEDPKCQWY